MAETSINEKNNKWHLCHFKMMLQLELLSKAFLYFFQGNKVWMEMTLATFW
jgi:hypothetical protein